MIMEEVKKKQEEEKLRPYRIRRTIRQKFKSFFCEETGNKVSDCCGRTANNSKRALGLGDNKVSMTDNRELVIRQK